MTQKLLLPALRCHCCGFSPAKTERRRSKLQSGRSVNCATAAKRSTSTYFRIPTTESWSSALIPTEHERRPGSRKAICGCSVTGSRERSIRPTERLKSCDSRRRILTAPVEGSFDGHRRGTFYASDGLD